MNAAVTRFLPLAPDLGIITVIDHAKARQEGAFPDLSKPPPGTISRGLVDRRRAMQLNRIIVMNADQLVFSSIEDKRVRRLVRNHRDFGIAVDHMRIPTPDGYISGSTLVVRRKR
jgi:hypothetical protein